MGNAPDDVFGQVGMGYVVVESERLDDWRRLLKQGLGLHLESESPAELAFRIDAHCRRFVVNRGGAEDVVAVGWQVRSQDALTEILRRLQSRGIAVEDGDEALAAARGVRTLKRLKGPKGLTLELFTDALSSDAPLRMLSRGFVTGDSGMGHIALTTRLPTKVCRFWQEIFDARLSDRIAQPMSGTILDVSFLRLNERHHSVAIAATRGLRVDPIRTQIQHVNMQVADFADLSAAYARCRDLGYEIAHEIGQHPNDLELSFYVTTPSGFEIELGWDALCVDEAAWKPARYGAISLWGHRPQKASPLHQLLLNLGNAGRGLRHAFRPEYSPIP